MSSSLKMGDSFSAVLGLSYNLAGRRDASMLSPLNKKSPNCLMAVGSVALVVVPSLVVFWFLGFFGFVVDVVALVVVGEVVSGVVFKPKGSKAGKAEVFKSQMAITLITLPTHTKFHILSIMRV